MRKIIYLVVMTTLSLTVFRVSGQTEKQIKIEISPGIGCVFPVGSYTNKDASESAIYRKDYPAPEVIGFAKSKGGFAKTGYYYDLQINYKLFPSISLLLLAGSVTNKVATDYMTDFLTQLYNNDNWEINVEEGEYSFLYITPGIRYTYGLRKFEFGLNLFAGYCITDFPYYKFISHSTNLDPPLTLIFAHDGPMPDIGSLVYGGSFSFAYKFSRHFSIGIETLYQMANFAYDVSPRTIPGGGGSDFSFSDVLKIRVINAGLRIGYSF